MRETARVSLTSTAWSPHTDIAADEWVAQGRRLGTIGRAVGWWIGDWLRYGNERFGERYARAARITGYDVQTLMNMVYVASRFDVSRRREGLSFSHHAEVAALGPGAQDHWLSQSESKRLSVRCLREELRRERALAKSARGELESGSRDEPDVVCPECGCRIEPEGAETEPTPPAAGTPA
jgi:hypothetical protein